MLTDEVMLVAGSFLEAPVRRPPAGSKNKSLHVYQRGVMATLCCCIPYFAKAQRDATAFEKETQRLDEGKRNQREWTVRNLNTTPSLINRIFLTLVWTAVCAALVAIFVGQFVASQSPDIFFSRKHLRECDSHTSLSYCGTIFNTRRALLQASTHAHQLCTCTPAVLVGCVCVLTQGSCLCTRSYCRSVGPMCFHVGLSVPALCLLAWLACTFYTQPSAKCSTAPSVADPCVHADRLAPPSEQTGMGCLHLLCN